MMVVTHNSKDYNPSQVVFLKFHKEYNAQDEIEFKSKEMGFLGLYVKWEEGYYYVPYLPFSGAFESQELPERFFEKGNGEIFRKPRLQVRFSDGSEENFMGTKEEIEALYERFLVGVRKISTSPPDPSK